ncbi:MAG: aminotransferase class I/II-fold pyridoxal phosphate-dependent enzyme, partial [Pirellulales bacterium]
HPFEMERMMSKFEQKVEFNLTESGAHPITLQSLINNHAGALDELLTTEINYPHVNGIPELRDNIALTYRGATRDNVFVTVGAIEANYLAIRTLLNPNDEIVVMLPNYMQIWGIAKNYRLHVKTFDLVEEKGWAPDLDELESQLSPNTKLVAVCNPNNPTGRILTETEMDRIVELASRNGSWLLADEVYRGTERLTDEVSPSFYGRYDKVIAIGSMSKAYGLPGLRIGWAAAPAELLDEMWARHEYIAISATMLSNKLAAIALQPETRTRLLGRTRSYIRKGFPVLQRWMDDHPRLFSLTPPGASAVAFIKYDLDINSSELVRRLYTEKSVLIVPGDHFGLDHHIRVSFGLPHDYLTSGLDRMADLIKNVRA